MTTMFSSVIPFQVEYDSWKLWNKQEAVAADWTSVSFDDAAWETKKAAEFGNHMGTTAYVRHEVNVPSIDDYYVLNVRVKYTGGVVVFFNGVKGRASTWETTMTLLRRRRLCTTLRSSPSST